MSKDIPPEERLDESERFDDERSDMVLRDGPEEEETSDEREEGHDHPPSSFPAAFESTHEHLLPFDTDPSMDRNENAFTKHSMIVEDADDSELEHLASESEDCILPLPPRDTTQHSMRTMYRGAPLKAPVDPYQYMDSLHSRLDSTHFRRNERKEDYLDFLFEKIESVACEMDGQPETVKDILDEAFEFMEDAACGKMARQNQAAFRQSFEKFLQQIDRLAALAPQGDPSSDTEENKDLLDILCQHFEKAACNKNDEQSKLNFSMGMRRIFSKELMVDIIAYFNRCTTSPTKTNNASVMSLLSVSEASSEGIERFKEPLCKISEESSSSFVSSQRSHRDITDHRTLRLRHEVIRRNHLRRLRGSIHPHVSKKDVIKKVAECRDTVHEAFGTAGEQISSAGTRLATIFENLELDRVWETLVLAMAFSPKNQDADDDDEMETVFHLAASDDDSTDDDGSFYPEPSDILKDLAILPYHSQGSATAKSKETAKPKASSEAGTVQVRDPWNTRDDPNLCSTSKDRVDNCPIVMATSSEDTYASGCGSGRSGSGSKRFQQVNDMQKIKNQFKNKLNDIGRLTPNSNMTEPTCDETISAVSDLDNEPYVAGQPIGARRLKMVDSESSRLDRMEMVGYMSLHNRIKEAILDSDVNLATEHSERSHKALSVDAAYGQNNSVDKLVPTVLKSASLDGLPPRPSAKPGMRQHEKAPTEICFSSRKQHDGSSLVDMPSLNSVDLDADMGKASNRSNRSLFLQDSGSVSAVSMDETPGLVRTLTANSGVAADNVTSNDDIVKQALSVVESFCESFVSARQSEDSDDVDHDDILGAQKQKHEDETSTSSFASARSKASKSRLSQTPRVLDEGPDDELHCVFKKHLPRLPNQQNDDYTKSSADATEVVAKGGKSWFSPLTDMFTSKAESPSWIGNQTMKAMLLLLYVSASVAATSTQEQDRFKKDQTHQRPDETECSGTSDEVPAIS